MNQPQKARLPHLSSSLKPTSEVFDSDFTLWPKTFAGWQNYYDVLVTQPYLRYLTNSMIVCVGILVVQLATAVPAAYALAKLKFRGSTILLGTVIACLTVPINVTSIPIYLGLVKAGLLDTYLSDGHRANPEQGCPLPTISAELGQRGQQSEITDEVVEDRLDNIAGKLDGDDSRAQAMLVLSAMVGSLLLSRSVKDEALSAELLSSTREQLKALTESA